MNLNMKACLSPENGMQYHNFPCLLHLLPC